MTELYWCMNCWQCNLLGRDGRCPCCGSDAIVSCQASQPSPEWQYVYGVKLSGSVFGPLYY